MRLMVQRKARGTFRPRLSLERTPYAQGGWQWCFEIGCSGTGGGPTPRQATIAEALAEYFGILQRLGTKPFLPPLTPRKQAPDDPLP